MRIEQALLAWAATADDEAIDALAEAVYQDKVIRRTAASISGRGGRGVSPKRQAHLDRLHELRRQQHKERRLAQQLADDPRQNESLLHNAGVKKEHRHTREE